MLQTGWLSLACAQEVISWENAHRYYGEMKTVEGTVVKSHNSGKAVFLNFHPNWKRYFTAVIFAGDFHKFPENPEQYYLNKRVRVTGKIKEHQGKPEIVVRSPDAIQILSPRSDPGGAVWEAALVERVMDGDTVNVRHQGESYPVRLIGVDTPETSHPLKPVQYFAEEATRFTRALVEGKVVRLEFDWQRRDKYDRLLAYVYLPDGRMLNAEIIKQGFGFAYVKYPFKHLEAFRHLESEARSEGRGLWRGEGFEEVRWLEQQGREPILITLTPRCTWEVRYRQYARKRDKTTDLPDDLYHLRLWTNEYAPQDLDRQLRQAGWQVESVPEGISIAAYEMTNERWAFVSDRLTRINVSQAEALTFFMRLRQQTCRN